MTKKTFRRALCLLAVLAMGLSDASAAEKITTEQSKPLPRVLLIGDSICGGYQQGVKKLLAGKAVVVKQEGNAEHTGTGLKKLDTWLGDGKWDVIHFNWGLWDVAYRNPTSKDFGHLDKVNGTLTTSLPDYEKNLRTLVGRLRKTGATLVWASTTPVPDGEPGRIKGDEVKYNAVAAKIMAENGIAIDELHAEVIRKGRPKGNNVHDTGDLSKKVADSILAALACAVTMHAATSRAADRKPNFLFVYTDDQRWDAMGVVQRKQGARARFPWFKSPNMDRLAAEGVRFRNAFVTLSLCAPSRAAFLTGRYNHLNGITNNHTPFPENSVTHATLLRAAGYRTAYIGKWHMGNQRGQRPGFDYSASFIAHGRYNDCPFEINGVSMPTNGWVDDVSTAFAIEWMKQHRDRPFSIVVGFKSPHSPRGGKNLPERLRNLYVGETSRPTPNFGVPPIFRAPDPATGKQSQGLADNAIHLDYLRHVAGADENLGKMLGALDELGLAQDTVAVYTSDNGYYLGEHCSGDKRSLYEESLRIPMLVRYPRLFPKGRVVDEMVLNIDLAPTFLDLAGVPVPREMQGVSWKSLAAGHKAANWRQSFLAEYFYESGVNVPTIVGVRTANAKLVKYPGHAEWTEVFDLAVDPYEPKNPATDPAATAKLSAELDAQVKAVNYAVPPDADKPRPPAAKAKK